MVQRIESLVIALCMLLAFVVPQVAAADNPVKIGTMSVQDIIRISEAGQAAKIVVSKKFDEYQTSLKEKESKLMAIKEEIEKKSSAWSEDKRMEMERDFKRGVQELEEESRYASNDMKDFEKKQVEPLLNDLEEIIQEVGKKDNYTIILDVSKGVVFQDDSVDLSARLAAELDKRHSRTAGE